MIGVIKYQFSHLFDLAERDARQTFWLWILFVTVLNVVVSLAVSVPMMAGAISAGLQQVQESGQVFDQSMLMNHMSGAVSDIVMVSLVMGLANLVLVAAAFVRRLHDSNRDATWAVVAGIIYIFAHWLGYSHAGQVAQLMHQAAIAPDPQMALVHNSAIAWDGLIGWFPLIIIIVLGSMNSDVGPNRYGDEPTNF